MTGLCSLFQGVELGGPPFSNAHPCLRLFGFVKSRVSTLVTLVARGMMKFHDITPLRRPRKTKTTTTPTQLSSGHNDPGDTERTDELGYRGQSFDGLLTDLFDPRSWLKDPVVPNLRYGHVFDTTVGLAGRVVPSEEVRLDP